MGLGGEGGRGGERLGEEVGRREGGERGRGRRGRKNNVVLKSVLY